ncbi:MAG: PIN domain-containing protein [Cyclobacteriaceae bacterium]
MINASNIINDGIVDETIALRKKYTIKLPDAIIAASALSIDAILITSDLSAFGKVPSLKILNPNNIK